MRSIAALVEQLERSDARDHREAVAVERAGVVHVLGHRRVAAAHDGLGAGHRPDRQAAADHLAERRQVRAHAGRFLASPPAEPEAHHLVEHEHGAGRLGVLTQKREQLVPDGDHPAGADQRLDEDRRQLARGLEPPARLGGVIDGERDRAGPRRLVPVEVVPRPVVGVLGDREAPPAGVGARQPCREHVRLGAGVGEAHALGGRDTRQQRRGEVLLLEHRRREHQAAVQLRGDRLRHGGRRMAVHERRVVAEQVDELVAVEVPHPLAAGAVDH